jgi:hypothetical protein
MLYTCRICERTFVKSRDLLLHCMKSHNGELFKPNQTIQERSIPECFSEEFDE